MSMDAGLQQAIAVMEKEEAERAKRPHVFVNTPFMEVTLNIGKQEIININTISEAMEFKWNDRDCTRIIFLNGEDITVIHPYSDIRGALKQYFK